MKKIGLLLLMIGGLTQLSFAQTNEDLEKQMMQGMQEMIEQLQQNMGGNSLFFMDTLMIKGFEDGMMPLDGNSFFFMDTLFMDGLGNEALPGMPFGENGMGLDLGKIMEEMQRGMQQMSPEDWEQLGKMFENFGGGQFLMPSPEELEKLKEQFTPPSDSTKQGRKTIRI